MSVLERVDCNASVFVPSLNKGAGGWLAVNTLNFRSAGLGSNLDVACFFSSLRKQMTFCDATSDFLVK